MNTVNVTLNFMGAPVDRDFVEKLKDPEADPDIPHHFAIAESVLGLPPNILPDEVLERYARLSTRELYVPFLPHTDKIFERLLLPFKSAKKCFCFGEFLATIELCAHVGEMLAQLVWGMDSPFKDNDGRVDELEKAFFGSRFERLTQERRVTILQASRRITQGQRERFTDLRTTRRKYFHLWSEPVSEVEKDSERCFGSVCRLVKEILQIDISEDTPGKVAVDPRLSRYLDQMRRAQATDG